MTEEGLRRAGCMCLKSSSPEEIKENGGSQMEAKRLKYFTVHTVYKAKFSAYLCTQNSSELFYK